MSQLLPLLISTDVRRSHTNNETEFYILLRINIPPDDLYAVLETLLIKFYSLLDRKIGLSSRDEFHIS